MFDISWQQDDTNNSSNDHTELTVALVAGDEKRAISIIKAHASDPEYFNKGPPSRTPLIIVLCGDGSQFYPSSINLYLAKLLVENGASPDRRPMPRQAYNRDHPLYNATEHLLKLYVSYYVSKNDFRRATASGLEGLGSSADGGKDSPIHPCSVAERSTRAASRILPFIQQCMWNVSLPPVIGLNHEEDMPFSVFREQVIYLFQFFMANSTSKELWHKPSTPMIHYLLSVCPDTEIIDLVLTWSSNSSLVDENGHTLLHTLCDVERLEGDEEDYKNRAQTLEYLLNVYLEEGVEINSKNSWDATPLSLSLKHHHFFLAKQLLIIGCSHTSETVMCCAGSKTGRLSDLRFFNSVKPSILLPLESCAPSLDFMGEESQSVKQLASLVDEGLFDKDALQIEEDLCTFTKHNSCLAENEPFLRKLIGKKILIPAIFGSKLQQLCARTIFCCAVPLEYQVPISDRNDICFCAKESLARDRLEKFLEELKLPSVISLLLEIQFYRLKLLNFFSRCLRRRCRC